MGKSYSKFNVDSVHVNILILLLSYYYLIEILLRSGSLYLKEREREWSWFVSLLVFLFSCLLLCLLILICLFACFLVSLFTPLLVNTRFFHGLLVFVEQWLYSFMFIFIYLLFSLNDRKMLWIANGWKLYFSSLYKQGATVYNGIHNRFANRSICGLQVSSEKWIGVCH